MSFGIEGVGSSIDIGGVSLCLTSLAGVSLTGFEKLDISCLSNSTWKTGISQTLKDCPDLSFTVNFSPALWGSVVAQINVNQQITVNFPDALGLGSINFYGFLNTFTPGEASVGSVWSASGSVSVTNWTGSEESGPVYNADYESSSSSD